MKRPFLILGFPRSGTTYTTTVFNEAGFVEVAHEAVSPCGTVSWIPPGTTTVDGYRKVVLQTRHPLAVIASATTMQRGVFGNMYRMMKCAPVGMKDFLEETMWAYVHYHDWALSVADARFHVEQMKELWASLLRMIEMPAATFPLGISTRTNARIHHEYTWDDLEAASPMLCSKIRRLQDKLGYDRELPNYEETGL